MKRVMVVLELEGGEAVVVHSKELIQHKEQLLASLEDKDDDEDVDLQGKFCL
tara:strand:+ start:666 stop:821 length:156 start_codon:yes stop_codon:yes gene_type:complete